MAWRLNTDPDYKIEPDWIDHFVCGNVGGNVGALYRIPTDVLIEYQMGPRYVGYEHGARAHKKYGELLGSEAPK